MTINPTEISDIIKDKIKNLDIETQSHNEGTVVSLTDGIARIYGITDALQGEMLEFPNNIYGLALNLERDSVGAVILGDYKSISEFLYRATVNKNDKVLLEKILLSIDNAIKKRG